MKIHISALYRLTSGGAFSGRAFRNTGIAALLPIIVSCSPASNADKSFGDQASQSVGCKSFADDFWDAVYQYPTANKKFPNPADAEIAFENSFAQERLKSVGPADRKRLSSALRDLYSVITLDATQELGVDTKSKSKVLAALTSLELGDRSTSAKDRMQNRIHAAFDEVNRVAENLSLGSCPQPGGNSLVNEPNVSGSQFSHWKTTLQPVVYGALKTLSTAYQSCDAGELPPMTRSIPDTQGIKIIGVHSDGIGNKRIVSDLSALLKSDYYLENYRKPASSCFPVTTNPLIYDYGGKPYTSGTTLDLFTNAGSGTAALGMDCSGYVYTSLAAAGMKLKTTGRLKAIDVTGISAHMFMNPTANGLTCFSNVQFSAKQNLQPGDILASSGHVVIIGEVGADPFGIAGITDVDDCTNENMSVSRFDFTILQSSSVKNGIGINHIRAADYLSGVTDMKLAMLENAVAACKANITGTNFVTASSAASLIRHSNAANCIDQEIALDHQDCVASCPAHL